MEDKGLFGFRPLEITRLVSILFLPFIITQDWFFYLLLVVVVSYCAYYIYMKKMCKMIQVKRQGVFVTGCDSGFGFGLAKHLDSMGFTVFAGCLMKDGDGAATLRSSNTGRMHVIQLDVTKEESVENALKYINKVISETNCGLWAIVNNAGIQVYGEVEFCTMDIYHRVAEVNLFGLVRMTKTFLPLLRKTKGRVINVTSVMGRIGCPFHAAYGITKYGAETFSDILQLEMRKFGVKVIVVEPGYFAGVTGILSTDNLQRIKSELDATWEAADDEVKATYGKEYYDSLYKRIEGCKPGGCPTLDPATNAFVDALTNESPQYRYLVDGSAGQFDWYCVLIRLSDWLPTSVMDYLRERVFLADVPAIGT